MDDRHTHNVPRPMGGHETCRGCLAREAERDRYRKALEAIRAKASAKLGTAILPLGEFAEAVEWEASKALSADSDKGE